MDISSLLLFDLAGVFVFAFSGALAAARKQMDVFGYVVLALLPGVGGGTLRDLILDAPVFWIEAPIYILVASAAGLLLYIFPVRTGRRFTALEWADAVGLSLFCVLGAAKAMAVTDNGVIAVALGVITAVVGGLLRDIVCNEIPLILRKDVYATAAIVGAFLYWASVRLAAPEAVALVIGGLSAFGVRAAALVFGWSLPVRTRGE